LSIKEYTNIEWRKGGTIMNAGGTELF